MTNLHKSSGPKPTEKNEGASPFIREFYIIECAGFRGMAYHNGQGKWRAAFDHRELPDDVQILL
jgi:hypothetical protein